MMVTKVTVDHLAFANRPKQLSLLECAANIFTQSSTVTHLLVRGSLASGTSDRMSDVDLVVGVQDNEFQRFIRTLDVLMITELGALLPGWRDTYVSRMGGLGYVYLVVHDGKLYEFDVYVVPNNLINSLQERTNAILFYTSSAQKPVPFQRTELDEIITEQLNRPQTCSDLLVEILILVQFVQKRFMRGQHFITYADTYLLINAVKNFIKTALVPASVYWGWYHLQEDVGITPIGRACLEKLAALISNPQIQTMEALIRTFDHIVSIVELAAPEVLKSFEPEVEAYRHYLELV